MALVQRFHSFKAFIKGERILKQSVVGFDFDHVHHQSLLDKYYVMIFHLLFLSLCQGDFLIIF